jgi:hypothetical protein
MVVAQIGDSLPGGGVERAMMVDEYSAGPECQGPMSRCASWQTDLSRCDGGVELPKVVKQQSALQQLRCIRQRAGSGRLHIT